MSLPQGQQAVSVPGVIEQVFNLEMERLTAGEVDTFSFDAIYKTVFGQRGIKEISARVGKILNADVRVVQRNGRVFMERTENKASTVGKVQSVSGGLVKQEKVPRPPNAFILYRQQHHPAMKAKNPQHRNTKLSQLIGAQWRAESSEVRKSYADLARDLKEQHAQMFPGYSYQPRKSVDKKRRMTAKKAAKVEALAKALVVKNNSLNNDFKPLEDVPKPALSKGLFGNGNMMLNFVLGDEAINPVDFCAMIQENNNLVPTLIGDNRRQNIAPIITASPASILDADIEAFEKLPGWGVYDNAHIIDDGPLDAEYTGYWNHPSNPIKGIRCVTHPGFAGEIELQRQAELLGLLPFGESDELEL